MVSRYRALHGPDAFMSAADNTAQARERSSSTGGSRRERPGYAVLCWLGQYYGYTKTPPTYHVKVPSNCVIATFQLYGSLMLESPDYFFHVREITRLHQTTQTVHDKHTGQRMCERGR